MLLQFFTVDPTMIIILSLKYLAEELVSLGENTERYIIFIVPIETSSFKIYPQEIHRIKCKYGHDDKKCKI